MSDKLNQVVWEWMKALNIPISKRLLRQKLEQHPYYPSAQCITDTLEDWGIENMVIQIEKENLQKIPVPFLAHYRAGEFLLINDPLLINDQNSNFYTFWSGIIILAEKPNKFYNSDHRQAIRSDKKRTLSWVVLLLSLVVSSIWTILYNPSLLYTFLMLINLAGISISVIIVMQEVGISNQLTQNFCTAGAAIDCNAVIKSKGSNLFKHFSWSDIGILYFVSQWFILMVEGWGNKYFLLINLLEFISLASLPFVLYSLYYQWKIIKKWCSLCLIIDGILLIQSLTYLLLNSSWSFISNWYSVLVCLNVFSAITASWLLMKPFIQNKIQMDQVLAKSFRFKNNPDVFLALLKQQRRIEISPFINEFEIASSGAPNQIVVVCNPYCEPCSFAHSIIHYLSETFNNQISIIVRFALNIDSLGDKNALAVEYLLNCIIREDQNINYTRVLLHDWFKYMDMKKFGSQYPITDVLPVFEQLKQHADWSSKNRVMFTPNIFIGGYEMPSQYSVSELPFLVKGMLNSEQDLTIWSQDLVKYV
jgi:uncharacterized membrane protein